MCEIGIAYGDDTKACLPLKGFSLSVFQALSDKMTCATAPGKCIIIWGYLVFCMYLVTKKDSKAISLLSFYGKKRFLRHPVSMLPTMEPKSCATHPNMVKENTITLDTT